MRHAARRYEAGLALAILAVVGFTALADSQHNYWHDPAASAADVVRQASMLGLIALGSAVVIISGGIDLSVGAMIAFSGTVCAGTMYWLAPEAMEGHGTLPPAVITAGLTASLLAAAGVGGLHALLITQLGLPPFVTTLGTLVGLRSLSRVLLEQFLGSTQIQIYDQRFRDGTTSLTVRCLLFMAVAGLLALLLDRTVTGRHLYALGGNEQAARLSGIRTGRLKWLAYTISAVCAALAGVIYIGDHGVANPQVQGLGYELSAIAAAVVGGCSLQGGVGTVTGTVLGAVFLRVVVDGVAKIIKSGADVYEGLIVGLLVVAAVAANQLRTSGLLARLWPRRRGAE